MYYLCNQNILQSVYLYIIVKGSKIVNDLIEKAKSKDVKIHLPIDFVVGDEFKEDTPHITTDIKSGIPDEKMVILIRIIITTVICTVFTIQSLGVGYWTCKYS